MVSDLLNRVKKVALEKQYEVSKYDEAVLELYQRYLELNNTPQNFDIRKAKKDFLDLILSIPKNERLHYLMIKSPYIWGMKPNKENITKILNGIIEGSPVYFAEDAFLRCVVGTAHILPADQKHYQYACG